VTSLPLFDHLTPSSNQEPIVADIDGGARGRVKSAGLQPLHARATLLARGTGRVSFEDVGRASHANADRLANAAMDGVSGT
jgi:hypothetical protein